MSWGLLNRQDIPDVSRPGETYLTRWRIIDTPRGSLFLHKINTSDGDRAMHDHPWSMKSFILRGGYDEDWSPSQADASAGRIIHRRHRALTFNRMELGEFHAIRLLHRKPTWTLIFTGPEVVGWGYATKVGFVGHDVWNIVRSPKWLPV